MFLSCFAYGKRLLPGAVPGPAGDGAAAVRRAAAEEGAELPRRLPGRALLLLPHRRVLLRPLHHLRQLGRGFQSWLLVLPALYRNGFSSGSRKKELVVTTMYAAYVVILFLPAAAGDFPCMYPRSS